MASDYNGEGVGTLTIAIATTHTHACYTLPKFIQSFSARFPHVALHLREGSPAQCCELVAQAEADIGIVTETPEELESIATLPAYCLPRCLVAPPERPFLKAKPLTLDKIARFPLITYDASFSSRRSLDRAFAKKGLTPNVVLRAIDADVSKKYVSLGLGVAICRRLLSNPLSTTRCACGSFMGCWSTGW